jgi:hypothetical protein
MKLRFTIRDLLWLTLVIGMGIGWWIDRQQLVETNQKLAEPMEPYGTEYGVNPAARDEIAKTLQDTFSDDPYVRIKNDPTRAGILVTVPRCESDAINIAIRSMEKSILSAKQTQSVPAGQ